MFATPDRVAAVSLHRRDFPHGGEVQKARSLSQIERGKRPTVQTDTKNKQGPMTLRCVTYDSNNAFVALEKPWRALAERTPSVSLFSSWEWQATWWKHYGDSRSPRIITVWNGGELIGLLPIYLTPELSVPGVSGLEARLIASGGDTSPDYLGALVDPQWENEVSARLIDGLLGSDCEWDTLRFTDMAGNAFTEALTPSLQNQAMQTEATPAERIQIVRLPRSWDEYLGAMSRERRYRAKRQRKIAQSEISAEFRVYSQPDELRKAFPSLIQLHRKRWTAKDANEGSFRTERYINFHCEVMERCAKNGWVRLYSLEVPGATESDPRRPIAMFYCYRYRDEILYFQSGFDPEFEKYSPGHVLMGFSIESAVSEGAVVFDMLKGNHPYKGIWANDSRTTQQIIAHRSTVHGLMALGRKKLKQFAKDLLPKAGSGS
jgi:CelD/BcsL family acetyltransferase involved in cellulose biosynthesis